MHSSLSAFDALPLAPRGSPQTGVLREHGPQSCRRGEVEAYIRRVYRARYGADVRSFAPILVSLVDGERIVAAAGYRPAASGPLFLERYLSAPVEKLLAVQRGGAPTRERIVEVGHLASDRFGAGMRLVRLLGGELAQRRFEWVVSTATQELRKAFARLKVVSQALGAADPAALGGDAAHWGSYYDHRPVVLAGRLGPALELLVRARTARKTS